MTLSNEIQTLRSSLGLSQQAFGELISVSYKTVARFEKGYKPTTKTLLRLSEVARASGIEPLADLFAAARKSRVAEKAQNLSSQGAAPRVPMKELRAWHDWVKSIYESADWLLKMPDLAAEFKEILREVAGMAEKITSDIDVYLNASRAFKASTRTQPRPLKKLTKTAREYILSDAGRPITTPEEINKRNRAFWNRPEDKEGK